MNYIEAEVFIPLLIILLDSILRLKYLIDFKKNKFENFNFSLLTLTTYIALIFSHSFVFLFADLDNEITMKFIDAMSPIIILMVIAVIIVDSHILILNIKKIKNIVLQTVLSILLFFILVPFGGIISICISSMSILIISYKYYKNIDKNIE